MLQNQGVGAVVKIFVSSDSAKVQLWLADGFVFFNIIFQTSKTQFSIKRFPLKDKPGLVPF